MMPIQSFSSFQRMTSFCRTLVPDKVWQDLEPIREDDEAVKEYGVQLCAQMCRTLTEAGVPGFHFYTLNLEKSVLKVLKEIGIEEFSASRRWWPSASPTVYAASVCAVSPSLSLLLLPLLLACVRCSTARRIQLIFAS